MGQGLPTLLPKGATVRRLLEEYILDLERKAGYLHVYSPALAKVDLYETSGHLEHYRESMFPPMQLEHDQMVLRPMNCPHHILVYANKLRSYRDLPLRIAELGTMYRYERSGVVSGLSRVRAMTLNDAHIFCTPEQIKPEFAAVMRMVEEAYRTLGITDYSYRLSLRDAGDTEKYVGDDAMWRSASACCGREWRSWSSTTRRASARPRSTGRSSTSSSAIRSGARRRCPPSRWTSTSPPGSTCGTSARTGRSTRP